MRGTLPFKFLKDINIFNSENAFVAKIIGHVNNRKMLLDELCKKLHFPDYFGFNWDALSECLNDFHWISEREIVIAHDKLPSLNDSELKIYLQILLEACLDWKKNDQHQLTIVFPDKYNNLIESILLKE